MDEKKEDEDTDRKKKKSKRIGNSQHSTDITCIARDTTPKT